MPEDGELGPTNPRINRWLEGVETAINEGTLYGREEDKSVSNNICTNVHVKCWLLTYSTKELFNPEFGETSVNIIFVSISNQLIFVPETNCPVFHLIVVTHTNILTEYNGMYEWH